MKFFYTLPWPPTLNHLYPTRRGRRVLSDEGKRFHESVAVLVLSQGRPRVPLDSRLRLELHAHVPDNRRRDLSNILKITEDALVRAGVMRDDSQLDEEHLYREPAEAPGRIEVSIEEIV